MPQQGLQAGQSQPPLDPALPPCASASQAMGFAGDIHDIHGIHGIHPTPEPFMPTLDATEGSDGGRWSISLSHGHTSFGPSTALHPPPPLGTRLWDLERERESLHDHASRVETCSGCYLQRCGFALAESPR